ncbi:hypothetical protein RHMOL_Rhmol05G0176800 [Rhododendron molle]|uniref:Uncharacterized protein n=1 Tax=Rhododendron molle TaxID=49168 RepID=A0ACC0NQL2_RHOML|nr:hypothetical protein RHMOL_Rhmol05G0176800 [Rhododendron molle]
MKSYYQVLSEGCNSSFPWRAIWKTKASLKVSSFVWCAVQGKILTIDTLIRRRKIIIN